MIRRNESVELWHQRASDLAVRWRAIVPSRSHPTDVARWRASFETLSATEELLRASGQWVSGPIDLLHIARVANGELVHSNVVAWLLDPTARHRLGASLLSAILDAGWPTVPYHGAARARVEREVTRSHRIADIVATFGTTTLVIENKVWSDESELQCEDLYQLWNDGVSDVRFLLLTLDGHPPTQTRSREAAEAWRSVSYASLATWLESRTRNSLADGAEMAARQYALSLRKLVPERRDFAVSIGKGFVDEPDT